MYSTLVLFVISILQGMVTMVPNVVTILNSKILVSFFNMSSQNCCCSTSDPINKSALFKNLAQPTGSSASKVTIVGAGQVGIACAFSLLAQVRVTINCGQFSLKLTGRHVLSNKSYSHIIEKKKL